jgi:hypothetical protein
MLRWDHSESGRCLDRFAGCAKRLAIGRAALPHLLLLPALLALPAVARGGEALVASVRPSDIHRSGCSVHLGASDARGIGDVTADCSWPLLPERVIAIVGDQDGIDEVLSTVSESTRLPDGRVVQVHTLGWAIADRQVTLRFRGWALPDGGHRIDFRRARAQQRLGAGRVQVALERGWWEIRPDGAGGTRLRYALRYDAGGNLPPWIVRSFQKAGVARSLAEVRRAAEVAERRAPAAPVAAGPR